MSSRLSDRNKGCIQALVDEELHAGTPISRTEGLGSPFNVVLFDDLAFTAPIIADSDRLLIIDIRGGRQYVDVSRLVREPEHSVQFFFLLAFLQKAVRLEPFEVGQFAQ
jgi:hypothetical protein